VARDFSINDSNRATFANGAIGSLLHGLAGYSVGIWAYADTLSAGASTNRLVSVHINGTPVGLIMRVTSASMVLQVLTRSQSGDSAQQNNGTTTITTGAWYHFGAAVNIAGDVVTPYVNGTAEGGGSVTFGATTYTHGTPTVGDTIGGAADSAVTSLQWDGGLAELAFFPRVLSAAEFASLARGTPAPWFGPRLYWPMTHDGASIAELSRGGPHATVTGTIGWRAHAPVGMPFRQRRKAPPYIVSAPGATAVPVFVHHYRQQGVA
jgi:hypothetical protein